MSRVEIAVMGYGTVGSGVVEVITTNQETINHRAGKDIHIKYVLDLRDFPGDPVEKVLVHDFNIILNDPEVKVVVEVMGGVNPAYSFVKQCLQAGKSVATSNKELVAKHGAELLQIAKEQQVNFFFEASVGGGIPILRPLVTCMTADEIDEISGILNGTTNYILSKMTFENSDFGSVLKEAQALGYAERNPEADVEGYDACRKIAILSSMVSEKQVDYEDIYTEGISKITSKDIAYANKMNRAVKLLARSKQENGQMFAMVAPFLLPEDHPLYSVNGVFNAVFVHGNMLGDAMFYGSGAGKLPTASAVVADVIDAVRRENRPEPIRWSTEKKQLGKADDFLCGFFVRVPQEAKEAAQAAFGTCEVVDAGLAGEIGLMTTPMREADFARKAETLPVINRIRLG